MLTVGHEREKEFLKKSHLLKKIPSALAFIGKEGIGKKLLALEFARGLLCERDEPFGCNECKSCRLVNVFIGKVRQGEEEDFRFLYKDESGKERFAYLVGDHPDLVLVVPDGNQIKIDQIRQLQEFVGLKPTGRRKVVLIDEAGKMNQQAQNALLKTLEEPPPDTHFVLIAERRGELLPTILSRCQVVSFGKLKPPEVEKVLLSLNLEVKEDLKKLLQEEGSLKFLLMEEEERVLLHEVLDLENLSFSRIVRLSEETEKWEAEKKELLLEFIERKLTDLMLEGRIPFSKSELLLHRLEEIKRGLKRGIKFRLALEVLLIDLTEGRASAKAPRPETL